MKGGLQRPPFLVGTMRRPPLPLRPLWVRQLVGGLALAFCSLVAATAVVGILPPAVGAVAFIGVVLSSTYVVGA